MKSVTKILFSVIFLSWQVLFADYDFSHNNINYKIVTTKRNWNAAAADAVTKGGKLVEINNAAEQTAIEKAITTALNEQPQIFGPYIGNTQVGDGGGVAYIWIGASDQKDEGNWCWDGKNSKAGTAFWNGLGNSGSAINNAYNNWGNSSSNKEPDNYMNAQDVAAIGLAPWPMGSPVPYGKLYQWNDINEEHKLFYIVEFDAQGGGGTEEDGDDEAGDTETIMTRKNLVYEVIDVSNVVVCEVKSGVENTIVTIPATISRGTGDDLKIFTVVGIKINENKESPFDTKGMTEVIFSAGIENDVHNGGFKNCPKLKKLTFSADMTQIPEVTNCPKFEEYVVPESSEHFFSIAGVLFQKLINDKAELVKYPPAKIGTNYEIPNRATTINIGVFSNVLLNNLTIGENIENIDFAVENTPKNNFAKILVHSNNTYFKSKNDILYDSDEELFLFPNRFAEKTFTTTNGNFYFNDFAATSSGKSLLESLTIIGESTSLVVSDFSAAFKEIHFMEGRPATLNINYLGSESQQAANPNNGPTIFISTEKLAEWNIEESSNPITILTDNDVPVNVKFYTPIKYSVTVRDGIIDGDFSSFTEGSAVTISLDDEKIPLNKMFQSWTVSPADVKLDFQNETSFTTMSIEFIMPKKNLTFTPVFINETTSSININISPNRTDKKFNNEDLQWSFNGGKIWLESNTIASTSPGTYTITFKSNAVRWATPTSQKIVVFSGRETIVDVFSQYIPIITAVPDSSGTVKITPADGRLLPGKNVVITATANKDYIFSNWDISNNVNSEITKDFSIKTVITSAEEDLTYTAKFVRKANSTVPAPIIENKNTAFILNVGIPFFLQLETKDRPVTFSITSGKLANGLKLDKNTGIISGIPLKTENATKVTFLAKNVNGVSPIKGTEFSFTINPLPDEIVQNFVGLICESIEENIEENIYGLVDYTISNLGKITGKTFTQRGAYAFKSQLQQDANNKFFFEYSDKNQAFRFDETNGKFLQLEKRINLKSKSYKSIKSFTKKYYTFAGAIEDESFDGFPGQNYENIPEGTIYGTITTDLKGKAKVSIVLADGTVTNIAGKISEDSIIFFSQINGKTGFFAGKITISADDKISFKAEWLNEKAKTYNFFTGVNGSGNIYDSEKIKNDILITNFFMELNIFGKTNILPSYFYSYKESGMLNLDEIAALDEYLPTKIGVNVDAKKGLIIAEKSLAPWRESDGSWNYSTAKNGGNIIDPAQTTFSFNLKTGLFSGSFNLYYDYVHIMTEKNMHVTVKVPYKGVMIKTQDTNNIEANGTALIKYDYQILNETKVLKNPLVRSVMVSSQNNN